MLRYVSTQDLLRRAALDVGIIQGEAPKSLPIPLEWETEGFGDWLREVIRSRGGVANLAFKVRRSRDRVMKRLRKQTTDRIMEMVASYSSPSENVPPTPVPYDPAMPDLAGENGPVAQYDPDLPGL